MKPILQFDEHAKRLDEEFAEYLNGKSVAIVGRANLHQMEQGEKIDSYDVVVRVHRVVPQTKDYRDGENPAKYDKDPAYEFIPQPWQPFVGKRCNIFYHRYRGGGRFLRLCIEKFEAAGGVMWCHMLFGPPDAKFTELHGRTAIRYVSLEHLYNVAARVGRIPLAGTTIICDILKHNVTKVYITGFPCHFDAERITGKPSLPDLQFLGRLHGERRIEFDPLMVGLFNQHTTVTEV